ncbi:Bowman-Birk type proteinase inhibitor D-II-like [Phoenix dactylifera]|uniref:Bowman-Birk type proteinase inhibitor D-II-like n=2 Tax=Phoenix dactylifera TaxID=42345 RepID=A0A8B7BSC8_PHODC|nr:Bowman-Birk type proteinase inhibitor D-II-like [Phoenix dactylifera]
MQATRRGDGAESSEMVEMKRRRGSGKRSPSVSLAIICMIAAYIATLSFAQPDLSSQLPTNNGYEGQNSGKPWPCCNRCGGCTRFIPPECQCWDLTRACHPRCKECVRSPLSVEPPLYQCMDRIADYCKIPCKSPTRSNV